MSDKSINVFAAAGNGALVMYPVRETALGGMFAYGVLSEQECAHCPLSRLRAKHDAVVYPIDPDEKEAVHVPYGNLVGVGLYARRHVSDSSDEDDCGPMDETHPTGGLELYIHCGRAPQTYSFHQLYCSYTGGKLCVYDDINLTNQLDKGNETRVLRQLLGMKTFAGIKRPNFPLAHRIATLFEGCYKSRETEEDDNAEWSGDESEQEESEEDGSESESEDDGSQEGGSEEEDKGESEAAQKTRKRGNAGDKDWQDFTADERTAAEKIGFYEDAWQKGSETPFKKNWSDLTEDEKSAAELLGYSKRRFVESFSKHESSPPTSFDRRSATVAKYDGNEPAKKRKQCDAEPTIHVDEESPSKKARSSTMYLAVRVTSGSCVIQTDRLLGKDETNANGRIECDREMFSRIHEILGRYEDKEIPCAQETKTLHALIPAFEQAYPSHCLVAVLKEAAKKATMAYEQRENARKKWKKNIEEAKKKSEGKLYETIAPFVDCCGRQNAGFVVAPSELEHARAQMERGQKYGAKELLRALQSVTK